MNRPPKFLKSKNTTENEYVNNFLRHYSSVDFLNVISIDDRRLSVDNAQVTSVDSSGMVIVWDLSDGSILQIKKIEPNASYLISETQPLKIISSYFKQDKIIAELLDLSTENRIQSIEGFYDVENELGSTPSHMITLQKINSESKSMVKSFTFFLKNTLEPNFFFANKNCRNFCIANKRDKQIWVSNIYQPGKRIKIDINMSLKILHSNHSFTSFIASDGYE